MKNSITSLFLLLSTLSFAQYGAQPYIGGNLFGGAEMILNQNNYGLPEMDYNPSFGVHGGVVGGLSFNNKNQVQMEINLSSTFQKYSDSYGPNFGCTPSYFELEKKVSLTYVQVPLLYRYVFTPKGDVGYFRDKSTWYINGGLQLGILAAANVTYRRKDLTLNDAFVETDWTDVKLGFDCYVPASASPVTLPSKGKDLYTPLSLDGVFGFGWQKFISENLMLGIELRTYISLTDINSGEKYANGEYVYRRPRKGNNIEYPYSASRNFAGGLRVNLCYYLER